MNTKEQRMLSILKELSSLAGIVGVQAEFEAEGTRIDELLRLVELARRADLKIALKIGGCEAVRDLLEAKQIGVDYLVAPMIETRYALSKFIAAIKKTFTNEERLDTFFYLNLETITGFQNSTSMFDLARESGVISGCVFGRVDYVGSLGLSRDDINSNEVTSNILVVSKALKERGLDLVVGGAISPDSLPALKMVNEMHLTKFETRKIIFSSNCLKDVDMKKPLLLAVEFELLWLLNKQDYYSMISDEDNLRIKMLNDRWKVI